MRYHRKRCLWSLIAVALVMCSASFARAELVLVEKGKALAPIVIFKDAPPFTRQAADELAQYIEKTSGAKMQIIEGTPQPMPEKAIWVGYQPALKEIFPQVDFDFKHPEEILIVANDKHLVIAGRDRWEPNHMTVQFPNGKPVSLQHEYGTCNAVYTFLQDHLGVRWLWPGALGEDILKKDTIAFAPLDYRYYPQIRYRGGLFSNMSKQIRLGRRNDWVRLQRAALGSFDMNVAGHGFGTWWERFGKDHPEYFALQPDGTRNYPGEKNNSKMCHSNPALWDQWLALVEEQIKENPFQTVFSASPNDGYASGHCVCDNCRAWDHPDGELMPFTWRGVSQQYVSLSDRHIKFANIVARKLKERYPDKEYYVGMLAYGNWRPAPLAEKPDDNVLIINVANYFWDLKNEGKHQATPAQQYADWAKLVRQQVWRPNTGDPAGWQKGLPDVPFGRRMEVFRYAAENKAIGIFVDMVWNHWSTQGPIYYLMAQLAWNPYADGRAILDDYYQRAFGPASEELKAYWEMMEQARNRKVDEFPGEANGYGEVYDAAFFAKVYDLLDTAAAKAKGAPEKYARRIAFVRAGLDYTKAIVDLRVLMNRVVASKKQDKEADAQARALWIKIEQMKKDHPDAINWRMIGPSSKYITRGGGLHPDHMR